MRFDSIGIEYLIVAMAGIILYLIYYVFSKDSQYHKNIHSVASVVEELNREIFYLKKKQMSIERLKVLMHRSLLL